RRPVLNGNIFAFDITQIVEAIQERLTFGGGWIDERGQDEIPDPRDSSRLRLDSEWRSNATHHQPAEKRPPVHQASESENDREPDQPHGHLDVGGWRESMTRGLNVRAVASVTA